MVWKMGKASPTQHWRGGILGPLAHYFGGAGPPRRGVFRAVKHVLGL